MASRDGGPLRVLGQRSYRNLWVGSVVSALGVSIGGVVLTWVVYTTTHSPLAVALLGVVGFLPTVLFGLYAGALIDRTDRRRLMIFCDGARFVSLGALAAYTLLFGVSVVAILLAAFLVAAFGTIFRPATNAIIPALLPSREVTDGNGLLMAGTTVASFVGSPVGGLIVIASGVVAGLAANAVTFAFSGAMVSLMIVPLVDRGPSATAGTPGRSLTADVREGLRYLASQRPLLAVTLAGMAANFFLAIFFQYTVFYATDQLHAGVTGFGILLAAGAGGFALGGIIPGRIGVDRAPAVWYAASWTAVGASIFGMAFTHQLAIAIGLMAAFGTLGGIGNTTFFSAVQRTVPPELLGRYFATDEAGSFAMIPAGQVVGGLLVLSAGVAVAYEIAGLGAFVGSGVLLLMPAVRRWGGTPPSTAAARGPTPAAPAGEPLPSIP